MNCSWPAPRSIEIKWNLVFWDFMLWLMSPTEIYWFGVVHEKVDLILFQKMYDIPSLGRFIWTTCFAQLDGFLKFFKKLTVFSVSTTKNSSHQTKNLGTPFFVCQSKKFSDKFFIFVPKKFADDVWRPHFVWLFSLNRPGIFGNF